MDLNLLKSRFDRINKVLAVTISAKGINAVGTRTVLKKQVVYSDYGYSQGYQFSVILSKKQIETTGINLDKENNNLIIYDGKEYRLKGMQQDSKGLSIRYDFGDKYGA